MHAIDFFSYFWGNVFDKSRQNEFPELCRAKKTTTKFNDSYPASFSMQNNDQILEAIEHYLGQIGYPEEPGRLYAPISYSLTMSGKRLRPMLLMLTCGIFSDQPQAAMPAAAAVEVFHNFTLLHDDIMDNAAMRRGNPSVFAKWGQNVAILSGDAMLISAYRLLSEYPPQVLPQILARFNTMAIEVCEGQQYDMDFETRESVSVEEYLHMIELKTSALLSGATPYPCRNSRFILSVDSSNSLQSIMAFSKDGE